MKTRLLLAALLALGLLFTVSGAALAEHSEVHDDDAGAAQYGGGGDDDDGGAGGGSFVDGVGVGDGGGDGTAFIEDTGGGGAGGGFSGDDQSGAGDGTGLAFTGFLAIPLLIVGIAMLGAGAFVSARVSKQ